MTQTTDENDENDETAQKAAERIAALSTLFEQMRLFAEASLLQLGDPGSAIPKSLMTKIGEMQTAHFTLLRAEEAFHDKIRNGTEIADVDFETLKLDIGGQLDRIRAAIGETSVYDAIDEG